MRPGFFSFSPLRAPTLPNTRAGVEEDEVCILRFLAQAVADIHQHALNALTVVDILLAAVAVNKCQRRRIVCLPDKLCGGIVMFKC